MKPGVTLFSRDAFAPVVERLRALIQHRLDGPFDVVTYDQPPAVEDVCSLVLMGDFERLDAVTLPEAQRWHDILVASGRRVHNNPATALYRKPLLDKLYAAGINDFRAFDTFDSAAWRWPVFLRNSNDHRGPVTRLLRNPAEFAQALSGLPPARDHLMAVEYSDIRSDDRLYRKYGVLKIGDCLFPEHVNFGRSWASKSDVTLTPDLYAEEYGFVTDFPHREPVAHIFDLAGIAFGRIDYGVKDGALRVWEINILPNLFAFDEGEMRVCPSAPVYYDRLVAALNAEIAAASGGIPR